MILYQLYLLEGPQEMCRSSCWSEQHTVEPSSGRWTPLNVVGSRLWKVWPSPSTPPTPPIATRCVQESIWMEMASAKMLTWAASLSSCEVPLMASGAKGDADAGKALWMRHVIDNFRSDPHSSSFQDPSCGAKHSRPFGKDSKKNCSMCDFR